MRAGAGPGTAPASFADLDAGLLQIRGERRDVRRDRWLRGHDGRRSLRLVVRRISPAQNPRLQQLARRALHGRAEGAVLRGIRVVALRALREIDLAPALDEGIARRLTAP